MKQEIREKSSEQKSLRSEKKGTSIFNVKKQMELSQRIAELTEDLEELCSERTMLLNQLDCADDKEVKKVKTSVSTMKDTLKNLEAKEVQFSAELDAAQKEFASLQEQVADFDPIDLYNARQAIRSEMEQDAVHKLQERYTDEYSYITMVDGRREVSLMLDEYAEEQRNKIRFESESFKKQELEKAETEGIREAYTLIQREMAAIRTEISSQLSRDEMASRKKIFEKRNKMTENVFEKVTQRLVEFTKTADYEKLMLESVKKIAQALKADDVIFFIKESDLKFADKIKVAYTAERLKDKKLADKIKSAFSPSCEVKSSKEIKIGGITGRSASLGLIADETLDTKLDGQREWFYQNSGLRVTE